MVSVTVWVADTGPLLHLHQAGLLNLLKLEERIIATPAVVDEWQRRSSCRHLPEWVQFEKPARRALNLANSWTQRGLLDRGEAEALAHALDIHAGGFLTDDTDAREFARVEGLTIRGSLGVVLTAAARKHLVDDHAREAWKRLVNATTLWISPTLRREGEDALEKILAKHSAPN